MNLTTPRGTLRDKLFDGVLVVGLRVAEAPATADDEEGQGISIVPEIVYSFPPMRLDGLQQQGNNNGSTTGGDKEKEIKEKDKEKENNQKETEKERDVVVKKRRESVMLMDVEGGSLAKDAALLEQIREFCFPDISSFITLSQKKGGGEEAAGAGSGWTWKVKKKLLDERFSFVLTSSLGERRWGYCARMVPTPRSGAPMLPLCFCILSFNPCFRIYTKILDTLIEFQKYRPRNYCSCDIFLKSIYRHPLPPPGGTLEVRMTGLDTCYTFTRPDDMESLLDHVAFDHLLTKLDGFSIVAIFASLLVERRIIFIADSVATLSSTTQALIALLYPFTWQHIFIPVLPPTYLHFCNAPMPFVCGVLRSSVALLKKYSKTMEEVILVDIDNNEVILPASFRGRGRGQDYELIPADSAKDLLDAIEVASKTVKAQKKKKTSVAMLTMRPSLGTAVGKKIKSEEQELEKNRSARVKKDLSNAFIGFMVDLLAAYRNYLIPKRKSKDSLIDVGENWCFDKAGFVEVQPPQLQPIAELVVQSQMFVVFLGIRSKVMGTPNRRSVSALRGMGVKFNGKFEKRLTTHLKKGAYRESSKNNLSGFFNPRSRFTMYENGQITRNEITKSFKQMREEEERKDTENLKKTASSPGFFGLKRGFSKGSGVTLRKSSKRRNSSEWDIELSKPQNFRHVSHLGEDVVSNSIFDVLELLCNAKKASSAPNSPAKASPLIHSTPGRSPGSKRSEPSKLKAKGSKKKKKKPKSPKSVSEAGNGEAANSEETQKAVGSGEAKKDSEPSAVKAEENHEEPGQDSAEGTAEGDPREDGEKEPAGDGRETIAENGDKRQTDEPKIRIGEKREGVDQRLESLCTELGLVELVYLFRKEDVTYEDLLLLSEEDLEELGIKMGPRKRLINAMKLKNHQKQ